MGGNSSQPSSRREILKASFSPSDWNSLMSWFSAAAQISASSNSSGGILSRISCSQFQEAICGGKPELAGLRGGVFAGRMFDLFSGKPKNKTVDHFIEEDYFLETFHVFLNGSSQEKWEIFSKFLFVSSSLEEFETILSDIVAFFSVIFFETYPPKFDCTNSELKSKSQLLLTQMLVSASFSQLCLSNPPNSQSLANFFIHSKHIKILDTLLAAIFRHVFMGPSRDPKTKLSFPILKGASPLISAEISFALNSYFPPELQSTEWRKLFCSQDSGKSFSSLVKNIVHQGPTLLLLKDDQNFIFGGFASTSWSLGPKYFGDSSCFLFSLFPTFQIYFSTGLNSNFLYLNRSMETLPNGIGFGGQFGYFGLFLQSDFQAGHSRGHPLSSTYHNPTLSCHSDFCVSAMQVWAVNPKLASDLAGETSVLKKHPQTLEFLEMAGKKMHSRDLPSF